MDNVAIKHMALGCLLIGITGCSSMGMNNEFACGVGDGLGCKSVSEVNNIVDSGHIENGSIVYGDEHTDKVRHSTLAYLDGRTGDASPTRQPEKKIKIWFAPHVDDHDNFVEEMVVYSVVKDAYWQY